MDDLREMLVTAKLAGTKAEDGSHLYMFRSNEGAAAVAVDVVGRWLQAQADELQTRPEGIDETGVTIRVIKAAALLNAARSLKK